ncbi:hypothetical protein BDF14DRAFT_1790905 [Spinellus fusiger]|nr:hypothetical protein BDF14DRAFT_1790905 [Spinellus fusiger]
MKHLFLFTLIQWNMVLLMLIASNTQTVFLISLYSFSSVGAVKVNHSLYLHAYSIRKKGIGEKIDLYQTMLNIKAKIKFLIVINIHF